MPDQREDERRELASLKREFQELREQQKELRSKLHEFTQDPIARIQDQYGVGRRRALQIALALGIGVGAGTAGTYLATERARAAATGELGTAADPLSVVRTAELNGGGSAVDLGDNLVPKSASTQQLGTSALPWAAVVTDDASIATGLQLQRATKTISSGEIAYSAPLIQVEGESGSADNLDAITGGQDGDVVVIARGGENITLRNNQSTGNKNLILPGTSNIVLDADRKSVTLMENTDLGAWMALSVEDT